LVTWRNWNPYLNNQVTNFIDEDKIKTAISGMTLLANFSKDQFISILDQANNADNDGWIIWIQIKKGIIWYNLEDNGKNKKIKKLSTIYYDSEEDGATFQNN
jgi:hypothetical protein